MVQSVAARRLRGSASLVLSVKIAGKCLLCSGCGNAVSHSLREAGATGGLCTVTSTPNN